MRRALFISFGAALAVAPLVLTAGQAQAAANDCIGIQTNQTFGAGLNVPAGQQCTLRGGTVVGNVTVQPGSAFVANSATINGSVNAQGAAVQLVRTTVTGSLVSTAPQNFQVPNDGSLKKVFVCGSTINGNVAVQNAPSFGSIEFGGPNCATSGGGNTIGGNLTDVNNVATPNHIISGNQIGNVLYCAGDSAAPTGSGNSARLKAGQCASL
jgi:hypothetical protein